MLISASRSGRGGYQMSQVRSLRPVGLLEPTPLRLTLERADTLDFALKPIGRSSASVIPQLVGDWWVQPLTPETYLPARAEARLNQVFEAGIKPKAVVVFYELPGKAEPSKVSQVGQQVGQQLSRFASVDVPAAALRAGQLAKQHGPGVLRMAAIGAGVVLTGMGLIALAGITAAVSVTDPCLVIVTEDGYWLEVDRWYH
jgi:hypothetical protein